MVGSSHLLNGFVYGSESGLLVVVVDTPVAVEDEDPVLLGSGTVAAVDAVVGTVIPLAREHKQPFCGENRKRRKRDETDERSIGGL